MCVSHPDQVYSELNFTSLIGALSRRHHGNVSNFVYLINPFYHLSLLNERTVPVHVVPIAFSMLQFDSSQMPTSTTLLTTFTATLTDANRDYIGSLTLPETVCKKHDLHARQLVHIRVRSTGKELWTYIITTPGEAVCLNGAAALLASRGDDIVVSAFHQSGFVECAVGKVHRATVTGVGELDGWVRVDGKWLGAIGVAKNQVVTVVNICNGKRDTVMVTDANEGECEVGVIGYSKGDLVIVMAYAWVKLDDLRCGDVPEMKVYFPENA